MPRLMAPVKDACRTKTRLTVREVSRSKSRLPYACIQVISSTEMSVVDGRGELCMCQRRWICAGNNLEFELRHPAQCGRLASLQLTRHQHLHTRPLLGILHLTNAARNLRRPQIKISAPPCRVNPQTQPCRSACLAAADRNLHQQKRSQLQRQKSKWSRTCSVGKS